MAKRTAKQSKDIASMTAEEMQAQLEELQAVLQIYDRRLGQATAEAALAEARLGLVTRALRIAEAKLDAMAPSSKAEQTA